jgi:hypothetical protein
VAIKSHIELGIRDAPWHIKNLRFDEAIVYNPETAQEVYGLTGFHTALEQGIVATFTVPEDTTREEMNQIRHDLEKAISQAWDQRLTSSTNLILPN